MGEASFRSGIVDDRELARGTGILGLPTDHAIACAWAKRPFGLESSMIASWRVAPAF
jgi:hypothetical protein